MGAVTTRAAAIAVAASALVLVAGCGSDAASDGPTAGQAAPPQVALDPFTPNASPVTLAGTPLDEAALHRAALTSDDLPAGFVASAAPGDDSVDQSAPETQSGSTASSSTEPAVCASVLAPISDQVAGSLAQISSMFTGPDFASIDQDSASYPDGAAANAAVLGLQTTLAACTRYSGTDADGTAISYRVGSTPASAVGDTSFSYRIITESGGFTLVTDVIVAAVGTTLTQVAATAPSPIAPDALTSLAAAAAQRLRAPTP